MKKLSKLNENNKRILIKDYKDLSNENILRLQAVRYF